MSKFEDLNEVSRAGRVAKPLGRSRTKWSLAVGLFGENEQREQALKRGSRRSVRLPSKELQQHLSVIVLLVFDSSRIQRIIRIFFLQFHPDLKRFITKNNIACCSPQV